MKNKFMITIIASLTVLLICGCGDEKVKYEERNTIISKDNTEDSEDSTESSEDSTESSEKQFEVQPGEFVVENSDTVFLSIPDGFKVTQEWLAKINIPDGIDFKKDPTSYCSVEAVWKLENISGIDDIQFKVIIKHYDKNGNKIGDDWDYIPVIKKGSYFYIVSTWDDTFKEDELGTEVDYVEVNFETYSNDKDYISYSIPEALEVSSREDFEEDLPYYKRLYLKSEITGDKDLSEYRVYVIERNHITHEVKDVHINIAEDIDYSSTEEEMLKVGYVNEGSIRMYDKNEYERGLLEDPEYLEEYDYFDSMDYEIIYNAVYRESK